MSDEEKSKETTEEKQEQEQVKEADTEPRKTSQEKSLTQSEVNKLMADERRKHEAKFKDLEAEYKEYRKGIEAREQAANAAAQEKVETLRKDLPEAVTKLLDKLTAVEQLEWLTDPENVITKKEIHPLPGPRENHATGRKSINIV